MHVVDSAEGLHGVRGERKLTPLHFGKADAADILKRGLQPRRARGVDRAGLELVRELGEDRTIAGDRFNHLAAGEERRHGVQQCTLSVQHAYAHGAEYLMPGEGEEVRVQRAHVNGHMRRALRPVNDYDRALFMRKARYLRHGIFAAEDVGHLRNGDYLRFRRYEPLDRGEVYAAVGRALDELKLRPGRAADHLPRQEVAVVLHNGDKHLIPRLHVGKAVAVGHEVEAFGGVARKDYLLRRGRAVNSYLSTGDYRTNYLRCQWVLQGKVYKFTVFLYDMQYAKTPPLREGGV